MVAITVSISDEVLDLLREMEKKTGRSRSKTISSLIKEGYKNITGKDAEIIEEVKSTTTSKGERTVMEIVDQMKEMGLYEADEVPEMLVKNVIAQVAGYDERTIQKYFKILDREMRLPEGLIRISKKPKNKTSWGMK